MTNEEAARKMLLDMGLPEELVEQATIINGHLDAHEAIGESSLLNTQMTDDEMRAMLRRTLIDANGYPPDRADEVLDLGFHARDTAIKALQDVCNRAADGPSQLNATLLAIQITAMGLDIARDNILRDVSEQIGAAPTATYV